MSIIRHMLVEKSAAIPTGSVNNAITITIPTTVARTTTVKAARQSNRR